jgi:hypothetical protein
LERYTLEKSGPGRLIDACVAAKLAYEASAQITEVVPGVLIAAFVDSNGNVAYAGGDPR